MADIHLIKNDPNLPQITPIAKGSSIFRSGYWKIAKFKAKALIGGRIYFHKHKNEPSFFGGVIESTEKVPKGQQYAGRTIFIFKSNQACIGKTTTGDGWGQEKKYT